MVRVPANQLGLWLLTYRDCESRNNDVGGT